MKNATKNPSVTKPAQFAHNSRAPHIHPLFAHLDARDWPAEPNETLADYMYVKFGDSAALVPLANPKSDRVLRALLNNSFDHPNANEGGIVYSATRASLSAHYVHKLLQSSHVPSDVPRLGCAILHLGENALIFLQTTIQRRKSRKNTAS